MITAHLTIASLALTAVLGASTASCSRATEPVAADAGAATSHTATGVVQSVDLAKKQAMIAHDEIPGYMKAMTMPFELRDADVARGLAAGDKISFTFTDDGKGHLVVQSIRKTP